MMLHSEVIMLGVDAWFGWVASLKWHFCLFQYIIPAIDLGEDLIQLLM